MLKRLFQTIRARRMWPEGARLLVGVSGGADSVALLYALHEWARRHPLRLVVAHLNHGIRGRAADRDEEAVRRVARTLNLPFICERVDVPALAKRTKQSLEMAARQARYEFFARVARQQKACAVAVAHTADDVAETLLLRLVRGAGLEGLRGIAPVGVVNGVRVVRPMLKVTRSEIEAFLKAHAIPWRNDETNRDPAILRNRIRHVLLPLLKKDFQPAIYSVLERTAVILRDEDAVLGPMVQRALKRALQSDETLSVRSVKRLAIGLRRRVLREWLRGLGLPEAHIHFDLVERVQVALEGTGRVSLAAGWSAASDGASLRVTKATRRAPPQRTQVVPLVVPGRVEWNGVVVSTKRGRGILYPPRAALGSVPAEATVRIPRGTEKLTVRGVWAGARIAPLGMTGSVKLQDLFVDQKVPRDQRRLIPLITCGKTVVWLPGYRVAREWAVPNSNAPCLRISIVRNGGRTQE